jgi:hypothetical protein
MEKSANDYRGINIKLGKIDIFARYSARLEKKALQIFSFLSFCSIKMMILEKIGRGDYNMKVCTHVIRLKLHQMIHKSRKYIFSSFRQSNLSGVPLI